MMLFLERYHALDSRFGLRPQISIREYPLPKKKSIERDISASTDAGKKMIGHMMASKTQNRMKFGRGVQNTYVSQTYEPTVQHAIVSLTFIPVLYSKN